MAVPHELGPGTRVFVDGKEGAYRIIRVDVIWGYAVLEVEGDPHSVLVGVPFLGIQVAERNSVRQVSQSETRVCVP